VIINENQTKEEVETAIQAALDSATPGQTVTLKGAYVGQSTIFLFVPPDITLLCEAQIDISHATALSVNGMGTFVLGHNGSLRSSYICIYFSSISTTDFIALPGSTIYKSSLFGYSGIRMDGAGSITLNGAHIHAEVGRPIDGNGAGTIDVHDSHLHSNYNEAISYGTSSSIITITGASVLSNASNSNAAIRTGGNVTLKDQSVVYSAKGNAIHISGSGANVNISGGVVYAEGGAHTLVASNENNAGKIIISNTGRVEARGTGNAIETAGSVSITDSAAVTAQSGRGLVVGGDVTVSDSAVVSSVSGITIRAGRPNTTITVSGGTVSSEINNAILTSGGNAVINVSGGVVYSEGSAHTIDDMYGVGSRDSVTINGTGRVEARGSGVAITTYGVISVSDSAFVSSSTERAISAGFQSTVTVSGGVVFSHGSAVLGSSGAIYVQSGISTISDPAVVVAWDKAAGNTTYTAATTTDLVAAPSGATFGWDSSGGIAYANGTNTGIIPINGVTVTKRTLTEGDLIYTDPASFNHAYTGVAQGIGTVTLKSPHDVDFNAITGGTIAVYYDSDTIVPTAAGTYVVEVRISGGTGYEAAAILLGNYTIAKAAAPSITYPVATTITYGEALTSAMLTGGSTLHGDFAWDDGGIYPTVANSGYTVNFTPNPHTLANYEPITTLSETVAITVNKATTSGVPQIFEVVNTQAHTYSYDLTALLPDVSPRTLGTVTYNVTSVDNTDGVLATEPTNAVVSPLTLDVANVADTGKTAEIIITVSSDNYNDFTAVLTVTTVPKQTVTITADVAGGIYNGMSYAYSNPVVTSDLDDSILSGITLDVLYESSDGGTYSNPVAPTSAGDYQLTLSVPSDNLEYTGSESFDFTIAPEELTITGLVIADKTYDGNTTANISGTPSLIGIVGSDTVNLINGTPTFVSKNAGDDITINLTAFSLTGIDAHNYTLIQPTGITANIHKANLTWGSNGTVHDKTYDGTTNATVDTLPELSGVIGSDDVTALGGTVTFSSADVGSHMMIASGWGITGTDIGNYHVPIGNPTFTNGTIIQAEPASFAIDIQADGHGTASADQILATVGTNITLTATPNSGYAFKEWQVLSGGVTVTDNQFIMPAGAVTIKAIFEEIAPPTPSEYTITSGANQSWRKGTIAGVTIISDGDFADFIGIKVDGVLVDTTNYTATAGSTITTMKAAYLETLALGAHTVELVFAEGTVQTGLTILNASATTPTTNPSNTGVTNLNDSAITPTTTPNNIGSTNTGSKLIRGIRTGDSSNLMLYGGLLTLASAVIVVLKKKKKQSFK